jgi:hypothetical protein
MYNNKRSIVVVHFDNSSNTTRIPSPRMVLSYLVSTAGHSQEQNDAYPHDIKTVLQLIYEGSDEFKEEKVVGFTSVKDGQWTCDRYCEYILD